MGFLPEPWELAALGTALVVGAVAVIYFLHTPRIAAYLGAAGAVLLLAASTAYTYEARGEAKIQVKLDVANAKLEQAYTRAQEFRNAAVQAQAETVAAIKTRDEALGRVAKALGDKINAQAKTIRDLRFPADARVLINSVIDDAQRAAGGSGADAQAGTAAASAVGDSTVGAVEVWAGTVIGLYGTCVSQVEGLQSYIQKLQVASVAAQPPNP